MKKYQIYLSIAAVIMFTQLLCAQDNYYNIIYYESNAPMYLDPVYGAKQMSGRRACSLVFRSLYGYNQVREMVDFLADGFPNPVDNEMRTFTLALRPNMQWHDGNPISSPDVIRSFQILKHNNTNYNAKPLLDKIESITADGQLGLVITFKRPVELPQYLLIFPILPRHILTSAYLDESNLFTNRPTGNGPFKINKRSETSIFLELFEPFTKANALHTHTNIQTIELKERYVQSTWVNDLMAGSVDILPTVPLTMIAQLEGNQTADYRQYPNYSTEMIGFNIRDTSSLLCLKFIRLAICHGTERKRIIDGILSTRADKISGPYPFGSPYYWSTVDEYDYQFDRQKARALLEENGCIVGSDGIFRYNGQVLKFELLHVMSNEISNIVTQFKRDMENIGILIETNPKVSDIYLSALKQGDFNMVYISPNYNEDFDISPLFKSDSPYNYWGYRNSTVDTYFGQLGSAQVQDLALAYGNQIHKTIHDDIPCFFLWTRKKYAGFNRKLEIFDPHPLDFFQTINEWRIRE